MAHQILQRPHHQSFLHQLRAWSIGGDSCQCGVYGNLWSAHPAIRIIYLCIAPFNDRIPEHCAQNLSIPIIRGKQLFAQLHNSKRNHFQWERGLAHAEERFLWHNLLTLYCWRGCRETITPTCVRAAFVLSCFYLVRDENATVENKTHSSWVPRVSMLCVCMCGTHEFVVWLWVRMECVLGLQSKQCEKFDLFFYISMILRGDFSYYKSETTYFFLSNLFNVESIWKLYANS